MKTIHLYIHISQSTYTDNNIILLDTVTLVANGTTLLSYEMTWQLKLFDLMTASEQVGNIVMGCVYGETLLRFLKIENELPSKKQAFKTGAQEELKTWNRYYADILMKVVGHVGDNIEKVRKKYDNKELVPRIVRGGN